MTMIEKVAAVIKDHFDNRWGQTAPVMQAEARLVARAAIEAMKEPTEEIIEAMKRAGTAQNVSVESIQRGVAVRVTPLWEAAINVALAEEPSSR